MPIVFVGSLCAMLFGAMVSICILTGTPCPIEGFDNMASKDSETLFRFQVFCLIASGIMGIIAVLSWMYLRRNWCKPLFASVMVILFALIAVMIWGIAESGRPPDSQVLIFASLQFLMAGLLVFNPIASFVYFPGSFALFAMMLNFTWKMAGHSMGEMAYLALLDLLVSWIVYSLFRRSLIRERTIADLSRRDELTGAKNRHYLRDDVERIIGTSQFIMLCDIDDFKRFNDEFDHDTGDVLLKDFYFALREAYGDECTYRYGGDEFLVVSPDFDEEDFLKKAGRCAEQLSLVHVGDRNAELAFSGGYVFGTLTKVEDFRAMLHSADEVLLQVKRSGKAHVKGHAFP